MAFVKRGAGAKPSQHRKLVKAKLILGLHPDEPASPDQVNDGFRRQMREVHPDNGGDPAVAAEAMKGIRAARDLLLEAEEPDTRSVCPRCKGSGGIPGTAFGEKVCPECNGAGATR